MRPQRRGNTSPSMNLLLPLLVALVAVLPASAQNPSPKGDAVDLFSDVIEVNVVNLEVVVTDRRGNLISGLSPEDFRIIVDGQDQTIDYFSEIAQGQALASDRTGPPAVDAGRGVGTNFLVYVDDNHTFKKERDLIVRGLIEDLDALGPRDRMAVVVQAGTRLETLAGWSNNRAELRAALNQLLDGKLYGGAFTSPLWIARRTSLNRTSAFADVEFDHPSSLRAAAGSQFPGSRQGLNSQLPSLGDGRFLSNPTGLPELGNSPDALFAFRQEQLIDLDLAMSGALSTLRGFDTPDGRKVMLMLTGDWPLGQFPEGNSYFSTINELDVVQPLIETANLLGYSLYPINDRAGSSVWRTASFNRVASRTGGRSLFDRNDVLADAVQDTRSYYWLGFNPTMVGNDQRHIVVVEVRRPGLKVRARNSYVDLSRNARLAMDTQGALLFGEELSSSGLNLEFGTPQAVGLRKMRVPATVTIPLDALTSLSVGGADQIQLELRFAVIDESGAQANVPMIPLILRGDNREGQVYEQTTTLLLRRRPHEVLASVFDPASGKTLLTKSEVAFRSR